MDAKDARKMAALAINDLALPVTARLFSQPYRWCTHSPDSSFRIFAMRKLPVVPICRSYRRLRRRANQNDLLAHPASMKRDVTANRHDT